eukprot:621798-Pyramimonas_sp.AAC.1
MRMRLSSNGSDFHSGTSLSELTISLTAHWAAQEKRRLKSCRRRRGFGAAVEGMRLRIDLGWSDPRDEPRDCPALGRV